MSDRIAVMERGRIVQLGPPREIYERPRTAFVAGFIGESNLLDDVEGRRIAVRPERIELLPPGPTPPGRVALAGTIEEVIYLGERITVLVAIAPALRLAASVRNDGRLSERLPWSRGDRVLAAWRPEDGRVLEETG
jgi:putative spermidine/putrescine transport system ATP-binding protein